MAWTDAETSRVATIEETLSMLQTAVSNLLAKQQFRLLSALKQGDVDSLTSRIGILEAEITSLQERLT